MLGKDKVPVLERLAHLNAISLLSSGVCVGLPEGRQILGCEVQPESRFVGQKVQKCAKEAGEENVDIVVILRENDVLLPNPKSVFKPSDRMLAIASPKGRQWIHQHFATLKPEASATT